MTEEGMKSRKRRRGRGLADVIIVLIFLAGLGVMLYPRISDWVNERHMSRAVASYNTSVKELKEEDYSRLFLEAEDYNRRLKENPNPFSEIDRTEGYEEALKIEGSSIMGYVTIEKIRVRLPFYHGTEESVLQVAIGHLEGSSLPVGEPGEHAVFSAHRGLPSAKLFTDLPELGPGDTFVISVLDREMVYEVDQILTVLPDSPEAFEALKPVPGEDLVTLMTCTPYGVNTHRLLVRGHRIEGRGNRTETKDAPETGAENGAGNETGDDAGNSYDRYVPWFAGAAVIIFLILLLAPVRKKR